MKMKPFLIGLALALLATGGWLSYDYVQRFFSPNVELQSSQEEFYVYSDYDLNAVVKALAEQEIVEDTNSFRWVANYKKFKTPKPGRYIIFDGMNNNQLVNLLRSGEQEPIRVLIRSLRNKRELAGAACARLECDSAELLRMLSDEGFSQRYGFTTHTIMSMFIPNTYEFYWNTSAEEFAERMAREYKRFWSDERKRKASQLGLTQSEVATLASIVQAEQGAHPEERTKVAGVYLNRLRIGMRLQSDPTLLYALQNFDIKRVYDNDKKVDSPYNTYINAGLPPGPILLPDISSIDAVLNAEKHNYVYMCAKADLSGYHNFSTNYSQHQKYANEYRRALNARKIYR